MRNKKQKKRYFLLAIIGAIVLAAVLTNPGQEKHQEAVKNKLDSYVQKKINPTDKGNIFGKTLGGMLGGAIGNTVANNIISRDNYVLFSTTKMDWKGEDKVIGIGAFGYVYVSGQVDEALDEGLFKK